MNIEFRIMTSAQAVDNLSDQLSLLGAISISWLDASDKPIYEPLPGEIRLWSEVILLAQFENSPLLHAIADYLMQQQELGLIHSFSQHPVENKEWVRVSLDQFTPQQFGKRLWICPSWCEPPVPEAVNILLDPGLAFGTGSHPTTRLCLEWLDEHIKGNEVVIDYGCGSGILAIAALKLGARKAIAVDYDKQALEACVMNLERNALSSAKLITCLPEELAQQQVDIIIANILAKPLIELAPHFYNLLKLGGSVILSGILTTQQEEVMAVYEKHFKMSSACAQAEWVRLEGVK